MRIFLGMICFAVFIIGISLLLLSFFKRKTKKRAVITIAIGFLLVTVGVSLSACASSQNATSQLSSSSNTKSEEDEDKETEADKKVNAGDTVVIHVSLGIKKITTPSVLGKSEKEISDEIHTKLEPPGSTPKIKHAVFRGDKDERNLTVIGAFLDDGAQLDSVYDRHDFIRDDAGGRLLRNLSERGKAVGKTEHRTVLLLQLRADKSGENF